MTTELATPDTNAALLEQVVVGNDLSRLTPGQRLAYYRQLCESLNLNPLTRPFQYITLSGRLTLYATKDATEQLRDRKEVSITKLENHRVEDVYVVTAYAATASGRTDSATGAVPLGQLKGEALANALMKAETKAKRRVTLSICGLGMLDESEVGSIPEAKVIPVDPQTGELPLAAAVNPDYEHEKAMGRETSEQEATRLFQTPDEKEQRATLIRNITALALEKNIPVKERRLLSQSVLAGATLENADLAALQDLETAVVNWKAKV